MGSIALYTPRKLYKWPPKQQSRIVHFYKKICVSVCRKYTEISSHTSANLSTYIYVCLVPRIHVEASPLIPLTKYSKAKRDEVKDVGRIHLTMKTHGQKGGR